MMRNAQKRQEVVFDIVDKIVQKDSEYMNYKSFVKQQIQQKGSSISQMGSRRNTFSVDCLREVMSFPFKKERDIPTFNFTPFFKKQLNKQLRRVLWQKSLIAQDSKQQFFRWDKQVTPYNIGLQFRITVQRLAQSQSIRLKQSQKDMAIRILQYTVKRDHILPSRSQTYLALNLVELFSFYQQSKVNQLGAIYCRLEQLTSFYFQHRLQQRVQDIFKALQLIDEESHQLIMKHFFVDQDRETSSKMELNQIFEHFRLSLGSKFLPLPASQYLIDQILIKKKNKFDIYVLFAVVIMVLGDNIQKILGITPQNNRKPQPNDFDMPIQHKSNGKNLILPIKVQFKGKQALNQISFKSIFQNSKQIIKVDDIIEAFNVVYEKIPAVYSQKYQTEETNKLFEHLLQHQRHTQNQPQNTYQDFMQINKKVGSLINKDISEQEQLMSELKKLKRYVNQQNIHQFVRIVDPNVNPQRLGNLARYNKK